MLLKVISLFLVFMLVMGALHKFFRLGKPPERKALDRLRCPRCRRINLTVSPGPCERDDCEYR